MKIVSIGWLSYAEMLTKASKNVKDIMELKVYPSSKLEKEPEELEQVLKEAAEADIILLYHSGESFWERIEKRLKEIGKKTPIICLGHDPSYWLLSTVKPSILVEAQEYVTIDGEENFTNMLKYIAREVGGLNIEVEKPKPVPWEGLYHPGAPEVFSDIEEYLNWYNYYKLKNNLKTEGVAGVLFSRYQWINNNLEVEDALIYELENVGLSVIPVFSYWAKEHGSKGPDGVVDEYFLDNDGKSRIDVLVKLLTIFLGHDKDRPDASDTVIEILNRVDVPVLSPLTSYYRTIEEWVNYPGGITGSEIAWSIALQEFRGAVEPIIVGANVENGDSRRRMPIEERCKKLAQRAVNWVRLRHKPIPERKICFVFHNNHCASVEATVGVAAHLDSLESVTGIMHQMKDKGYNVCPPADSKELITTIMDRKAISEFRWTTTDEIVKRGGVLKQVPKEEYEEWFNTLSPKVKERMNNAWGKPPGEELNGVPPAMVYDNKILVTGVQYGNVVVCVQPKRGCAGARCDGQVCKILHDPDIPPPHQYLATYRYLEYDFRVDVIIHVGTHGTLEWLPGKGVALSSDCYPDIAIGNIPHLYIYNADNPPEGTVAKRRSYAVLVDHMQTVLTQGGLYDELEELGRFLDEYEKVKNDDPGRTHVLKSLIIEAIKKANIDKELKSYFKNVKKDIVIDEESSDLPFDEIIHAVHNILSRIRNTQIQDGMHIFGQLPEGDRRIDFINSILRYDAGQEISLRKIVAMTMGLNLSEMLEDQGKICQYYKKSYGQLLEEIDGLCKKFICQMLNDGFELRKTAKEILDERLKKVEYIEKLKVIKDKLIDLNHRIEESREIDSLLHGFNSGYILPGPSGLITHGRDDILPTGRNFYSLDPYRVPTKAAWEIGKKLADAIIKKHMDEEGRFPENIAMWWMCNDVMWTDGEGMSQIMYLLGVRPIWHTNGRVKGFEVMSLEELNRPRIDVTIRLSEIMRDNFPNCIEFIDEAIQAVASLPEPEEMNFVRKHSLAQIAKIKESVDNKSAWRDATLRIFAAKPGAYGAGTQLAVYASAWKEEKDLGDVFLFWSGYAYGKGIFGEDKHKQLAENLRTVDITYNKTATDEYDLFSCCCYFGTHGGMTAAARSLSGKEVKVYYGDTREPEHVEVRDLADEIRRVVRTKLLNPKWIEGMKRHGYKGAGDISKRIGRVYGWEATTQEVDDWIFDDIAKTFVLDEVNREFFKENNPWALEEIGRRLLEAHQRGLWEADTEVLEGLKNAYLECEGWIEEKMGDTSGDFQGGAIDILTVEDVADWKTKMKGVMEKIRQ